MYVRFQPTPTCCLGPVGWPMSVVQALLVGSELSVVWYMNAPPPPFHSSRNDALPYCIAAVSPARL